MDKLNLSSDLFIGKAELQRLFDFLSINTFKKLLIFNSYSFGIIRRSDDINFDNFKVESGTNTGTIKIDTGSYALDKNGEIIYKEVEDNIALVDDNQWYWVKIAYKENTNEVGTVAIDSQGNLTGSGTAFGAVLRGQPNHPSRIKFTNGSLNTGEYVVQEVISDTSAVLLGTFSAETDLRYAVVGTFTPGVYPASNEKYPFQYSGTLPITVAGGGLVLETVLNTEPAKTDGEEFYIARVRRNGSTVTIQDKRTEFWQIRSEYLNSYINRSLTNALIGVESIKYDNQYSTLNHNIIQIGWGMRSTNWVVNSELRRITIVSAEESGKFKNVSNFTDNDFNGWRIYAKNGTYKKIISSVLSGGQINLILDTLDADDYTTGDNLIIVPDVDDIQIKFNYDAAGDELGNVESIHTFPIRQGYGSMKIIVPINTGTYSYNVSYRYKLSGNYTDWLLLPNDTINGYYDETSFDTDGVLRALIDRNRKTYTQHATNGYIEFIANGNNYYNIVSILTRGDTYGVNRVNLSDEANNPEYTLTVGSSEQVQIFEGTDSLDVDWFVILESGLEEQNEFYLFFENTITLNGFNFRLVENYVNAGDYDELINFGSYLITQATNSNLLVKCTWDGSTWHVFKIISSDSSIPDASTTQKGAIEIATNTEVQTGTDTERAVTPSGLSARTATETRTGIVELATALEVQAGADSSKVITPATLSSRVASESLFGIAPLATLANALVGTNNTDIMTPLRSQQQYENNMLDYRLGGVYLTGSVSSPYSVPDGIGKIFCSLLSSNLVITLPSPVLGIRITVTHVSLGAGTVYVYDHNGVQKTGSILNHDYLFFENDGTDWFVARFSDVMYSTFIACPFVYINGKYLDEILKNQLGEKSNEVDILDITNVIKQGENELKITEEKDEISFFEYMKIFIDGKEIDLIGDFKLEKGEEKVFSFNISGDFNKVIVEAKGYYINMIHD